jgi:type IV pilus assembly protein PilQ
VLAGAISLAPIAAFGQTGDSTRILQQARSAAAADSLTGELYLPPGASDTTTLSFKDTDLRDIYRALSHQHGVNIFLDNSIAKRATISLVRVRVYDAIKFLAEQNGLTLRLEGGIFKVLPPPPPVQPEPPPPKVPLVGYENGLLSVALKDDELERVILEIQKKSGKNILALSGTSGTVSGKLMDVEFDVGFTQLMNNSGFAVQKRNGIYLVSRLDYFVGTQGTTSPQKTGPYWISVKDSMVTIDVTNAQLERVIADVTRQLNTDIVFYNAVSGTVTARAGNVPLKRALDLILRNTNYTYRESEGVYFVGEKSNKALASTQLLRLTYLTAEQILEMIPQSLSSQATLKVMKEHNGIVAIGPMDVVDQLREFLAQIDKPVAQVLIEALVVDYDLSKGSEFGIQAGVLGQADTSLFGRAGSLIPGINLEMSGDYINRKLKQMGTQTIFGSEFNIGKLGKLPSDFYLRLKAMQEKGVANVKSRPILATLNGHKASLSIGTTQYFLLKTTTPYRDPTQVYLQESQSFQTIEADVKLEITPYVGSDGQITVEIKPDFRTPVGQLSPEIPPTINRRALNSTIVMREGETIVLGGMVQESESETRTQVPILGSIPLLGSLFSSTTKNNRKAELLIYVTPHLSYGEAFQNAFAPPKDDD